MRNQQSGAEIDVYFKSNKRNVDIVLAHFDMTREDLESTSSIDSLALNQKHDGKMSPAIEATRDINAVADRLRAGDRMAATDE